MKDKIKEMVENGFAIKRIASILKLESSDVKRLIADNNYQIKLERFSDNKRDKILELYAQGVSAKNLGFKFSIDKRRVQRWVREHGVERTRSESHRFTFFNENYFDEIDTPSKAYWLGFLYADAYNCQKTNTISLSLQTQDKEHLKKIAKTISLPDKITFTRTKDNYTYNTLKIYSKHMCHTLAQKGCPQAKSFIIRYPNWLEPNLNAHFIRGLFDGDGCLTKRITNNEWKWSLVSTKECCKQIQSIIGDNLGLAVSYRCISKDCKNTYELETSGNEKIHKLMKWLYNDSTANIRMDRKFTKYEELIDQQNNRNISRPNYLLSDEVKNNIVYEPGTTKEIAAKYEIHPKTVLDIKRNSDQFSKIAEINGKLLTAKYIRTLSKQDREQFVEPLFEYFREAGWIYPTISDKELKKDWQKLCNYEPDISTKKLFNNSSMATSICKHFCKSFWYVAEKGKPTMLDLWDDDEFLNKLIKNRLVINWNSSVNETFNISHRMMIQGMRSMRAVSPTTMFKPNIAKYICTRYSNPGDVVGDYSAGFGGRMLGAASCGRKYIGIDPLTVPELREMRDFFGFEAELIHDQSENVRKTKNCMDLCWSSPPYYDQEYYSSDESQAYSKGEHYFYNVYWKQTLLNVKHMLKPGGWFGLNIKNYTKMLEMAQDVFGDVNDKIALRTIRSHLNKKAGTEKYEYIYMFINDK